MSAKLAPDASVVAKVFLRERESVTAWTLLNAHALVGPELVAVETASAIVRRHRTGGLSRPDAETALRSARLFFPDSGMALTADAALLPRAEEIALDLKHALKDCLYIALAERESCELVTTDATLIARASAQFPFVRAL